MIDWKSSRATDSEIEERLAAIETMSCADLKSNWPRKWGRPPETRSVWMMRRLFAWRLQAEHYDGFDRWTALQLSKRSNPRGASPPVGSVISREYQGRLHQVEVLERGFQYRGDVFRNLSEIAEQITGTHWNGPSFFGLRKR